MNILYQVMLFLVPIVLACFFVVKTNKHTNDGSFMKPLCVCGQLLGTPRGEGGRGFTNMSSTDCHKSSPSLWRTSPELYFRLTLQSR